MIWKNTLPAVLPRVAVLCLALLCLTGAGRLQAEEIRVSSPEELRSALTSARAGVIVLAPGDYGELRLEGNQYPERVTLRSEVPRKAVFEAVSVMNAGNLGFEGLKTRGQFRAEASSDITISDCLAENMLYFRSVAHLEIRNCQVSGGQYGVLFNSVTDFSIRQSRIGKVSEDVMRITGESHDGVVEYNILDDVVSYPPTHPDLIQMFGARGQTPFGITIRRNLLRDDHATGSPKRAAQGVFVSDPGPGGYHDILIEENVIRTRAPNTIYINGGQKNVVVRGNTLLSSVGDGGAIIRLARKSKQGNPGTVIQGNVAKLVLDETKDAKIGRNYLYGRQANLAALFAGADSGARWQDYLPVVGTAIDRDEMGATPFLKELLAAQKPGVTSDLRLGPDWSE